MNVTQLIRKSNSAFCTSCKVYGVEAEFKSYESALRYVKANKANLMAKYDADCQADEQRNLEDWRSESKIAIARALVANGYSLEDSWNWMRDATDETLSALATLAKTAPALIHIA